MTPTPRQLEVLRIVRDLTARHGYAPTYAEIGAEIGISVATVCGHVWALDDFGLLIVTKHRKRDITLTDKGLAAIAPLLCPQCGHCLRTREAH